MPDNTPRVLVTRPAAQACAWVQALGSYGVSAQALPLIDIAPWPDASAVQQAWREATDCSALMFVSANAVHHFMAARPQQVCLNMQAWATGPGTKAALLSAGWPHALIRCPELDAPYFDSEALWDVLCTDWSNAPHHRVLVVRGSNAQGQLAGRGWLVAQLKARQVQVMECAAYLRRPPLLDADQHALGLRAIESGSWWLFSSAQAAQHAAQLWPQGRWQQARALATHPRIAHRLVQLGWGSVQTVAATASAQAASIKSLP